MTKVKWVRACTDLTAEHWKKWVNRINWKHENTRTVNSVAYKSIFVHFESHWVKWSYTYSVCQVYLSSEWPSIWIRTLSQSQVVWTSFLKDWVITALTWKLHFQTFFFNSSCFFFPCFYLGSKMKLLQIKWKKKRATSWLDNDRL